MPAHKFAVYVNDSMPDAPPADVRLRQCVEDVNLKLPLEHASMVDLGCNAGQLCYYLKEKFPESDVYGVEFDITSKHDGHFNYIAHDLTEGFPYPGNRMDVVFALEILEHVVDTDFFLAECLRILKPQGWLVITTPNICGYRNRIRVPFGLSPLGLEYKMGVGHVKLYNRANLISHLKEIGFKDVDVHGTHMLPSRLLEKFPASIKLSSTLSLMFPSMSMGLYAFAQKP